MTPEIILPDSEAHWLELRTHDVTSTEIAALFDASPYMTAFELWHRKAGKLDVAVQQTERTMWGTRLQDAIALGVAADNGWEVRRMEEYIRIPELRAGSSFDFSIEGGVVGPGETVSGPDVLGLLEVKNVDHWVARDGWIVDREEDGTEYVEAPVHIEMQVQHQMMVSGRPYCYIAALIGGNRIRIIRREPDPVIVDAIHAALTEFWASIAEGREPVPNFERDAKVVAKLHGFAESGKVMTADTEIADVAVSHSDLGREIREMEGRREGIKAQLLTRIGGAEKVTWDGGSISAGMVAEAHVEYDRKAYRNFRVNLKKPKDEK